jgi:Regulator of Chromosome Condensation (RCC1) repeat protein/regulator of chromosome condensation (RCC1) repeat-containing protein
VRGAYALVVAVCLVSCGGRDAYVCTSDSECISKGVSGTCEPEGFCAFPDGTCESGQRFEPSAGAGLGGECTVACGRVGQACCDNETACTPGATCSVGTCAACVADIALGRRFACALHANGTVLCSGENAIGQLGVGATGDPIATPRQVTDSTTALIGDATVVAAGHEHACAVRTNGEVWCWGRDFGPLAVQVQKTDATPLTGIVEVQAGNEFTCGRDGGGMLWCWGQNGSGQLGDSTVVARAQAAPVQNLAGVASFTVGALHVCATDGAGAVSCWGENGNGQLGDGTQNDAPLPVHIMDNVKISAGMWHTCALQGDGTITCWGWSGHGRLGYGKGAQYSGGNELAPVMVLDQTLTAPFTGATAVSAGGQTCAITSDTHVFCWGDDAYGQTGTGSGSVVPVEVILGDATPLTGVDRLITHYAHVCAHRTDGTMTCWGRNTEGALGDGTLLNRGLATPLTASCP